jgi:hypothetical protein
MHETTALHFDLSHLACDQEFTLHVGLGRYTLTPHTRHTLAKARQQNKAIALLPDERVTHFAGSVQLPAHAPILLRVTAPKRQCEDMLDRLVLTSIRIPRRYRAAGLARRRHRANQRVSSKLKAYGLTDTPLPPPDDQIILDSYDYNTSHDAAYSLVFHHPELLTLQAAPADTIMQWIEWARGIDDLANLILNEPNWVTSQPSVNWNPKDNKEPPHIYVWSDKTVEKLKLPVQDTLEQTKNDPELENQCWTVQQGIVQVPLTPVPPSATAARQGLQDAEVYYQVKQLTPQYGVENQCSYDPTTLTATVSLKNHCLRWLEITVDQYGADDTLISTTKMDYLSPPDSIMAVPIPPDWSDYSFTFTEDVAYAILTMGGLGQAPFGQNLVDLSKNHDFGGIFWTSLFNLSLPSLFIALGVSIDILSGDWSDIAKTVIPALSTYVEVAAEGPLGGAVSGSVSLTDVLAMIGNLCTSMLTDMLFGTDALVKYIGAITAEEVADAAPFVGWIARAIASAADVASIIETSVAVANSPANMQLEIIRIMDLQVTVNPDPNHQGHWPETATHYRITVTYEDGTTYTYDGQMSSTTQEGTISHTFNGLPTGGKITILACFYSDTGWLAGQGKTDPILAAPNQGNTLNVPAFAITEFLVPLTPTTTYSLKEKLGYGSQGRIWLPAQNTSPPTATVSDLDEANTGNNLGKLGSFGLNEAKSALAYVWQASGQNLPLINTGTQPYSGQMYTYQCVSDGQIPESGLKLCSYGYTPQICLALPPATMPNPVADGFLLEPSADPSGDMYLRALSLETGQPIIVSPGNSFGQFTGPQDALAIHPAGYAVALSISTCKLQIVKLGSLTADAQAPVASILSGRGQRPGLLDTPIALTCSIDRILVLQTTPDAPQGCIAAFDFKGNPVYGFANNQWSMNLHPEGSAGVVPLDLSVESKGYIYVLKYLQPMSRNVTVSDYRLDIYNPDGSFLTQISGIAAARMQVDLWRNLFTLNYEILLGSSRTEPTVAQWIPSTPNPTTSTSS